MLTALCIIHAAAWLTPPEAPPRPVSRLIVVAPPSLIGSLTEYVAHRSKTHSVTMLSLIDALKTPGQDDPERLKRWLYADWSSAGKPSDYSVLLVGDADVLPVRYMVLDRVTETAFDYAFYPCDLYYADLAKDDAARSFDHWNAAADGFHADYFGEVRGEKNKSDPMNFDGVSYTPDIAVGRWPVNSPDAARAVADKTIAYENAIARLSTKPKSALVMVGGWVDARPTMNTHAVALEPTFDVTRLYYQDGVKDWSALTPPTAQAVTELLSGSAPARLVLHAGHGSDTSWDQCISTADIPAMRSAAHPSIIMSAGCSTARFATCPPYEAYEDSSGVLHKGTNNGEVFTAPPPPPAAYAKGEHNFTGLGEELLRSPAGGAVVYIGCNTGSQPAAMTLMAGFVDAITTLKPLPGTTLSAGECWKHALTQYVRREGLHSLTPTPDWYPASIFFQGMKFMFFGDPTTPI